MAANRPSNTAGHRLMGILPSPWIPYAELIRLHKPTGIFNIYFPYLFGALYASWTNPVHLSVLLARIAILFLAAFVLRSLGCSWNDIVDRNLDRHVARCRLRPMARGAISVPHAVIFTAVLYAIWLSILVLALPSPAHQISYILPLTCLVAFYPFAKRITHHAQVVLGVTLAWGVWIGSAAMDTAIDPFPALLAAFASPAPTSQDASYATGLASLFLTYLIWSIIHDTIYAQQDLPDDLAAGVKSMAVYYRHCIKPVLVALGSLQVFLHVYTGSVLGAHVEYQVLSSGGSAVLIAYMLWRVDLGDPGDCAWWFRNGCLVWGWVVAAGLGVEVFRRW